MTNIPCCPMPLSPTAHTEGLAYLEAMYHLCKLISERLNPDAAANADYRQILDNCQAVENIREKMLLQLREKEACKTVLDRLQHYAIRLHTSFVVSVCCRPALMRRGNNRLTETQRKFLAERCKANLAETVRMFLAMHQLSVIPTRSWAFTYHGLSSAVLLGILGETKTDPEVRQLQGDLISALSATAAKEQTSPQPHIRRSELDIELSGPLSRALTALKNIYDHGSVFVPQVKREGSVVPAGSGSRTPLQPAQTPGYSGIAGVNGSESRSAVAAQTTIETQLDAHQNAALAMTELQMQNGGGSNNAGSADFSAGYVWSAATAATAVASAPGRPSTMGADRSINSIPFSSVPAQQEQIPEIPGFDGSGTYMSPMEMYESIFWGKSESSGVVLFDRYTNSSSEVPNPWNTGFDSMNFEFLPHPPPGQPSQQQFYF